MSTAFLDTGYLLALELSNDQNHQQADETLFFQGWAYFQQHQDKKYFLTDCLSFMLMQNLSIKTAYSFDKHFEQAGFLKEPSAQ
jgi:predicted nucleic acid-binding protein